MSFEACAQIVQRGDPERFLAVMAAPVAARRVLFPIYAFNVEVSRAPWVTEEPMIAEMRLQWWRDALEEIANGGPVRRHEVTSELAKVLDGDGAKALDGLVAARRWDIYKDAHADAEAFRFYLEDTAGVLMHQAARALGADDGAKDVVPFFGASTGLVRYLQAVPALEARGRVPLVDGRVDAVRALATEHLKFLPSRAKMRDAVPPAAMPALIEGWQTEPLLRQIAKHPSRVADGAVGLSPFRSKWRLMRWS